MRAVRAAIAVALGCAAPAVVAQPAESAGPVGLPALLAEAQESNPHLSMLRAQVQAAVLEPVIAGSLPDPRVGYGLFIEPIETRTGPQRHRLSVSQSMPWFGTLQLQARAAELAAQAQRQELAAAELELAARVTAAYVELYYIDAAIRLTEENVDVLARFERIVRTRYTLGTAQHPDLIRAQLEIGKLESRVDELKLMRKAFVARLNETVGRDVSAGMPPVDSLPAETLMATREELLTSMLLDQPRLERIELERARERVLGEIARKKTYPGLEFGLSYTVIGDPVLTGTPDGGQDAILAQVGVSVPLWRKKNRARIAASSARERALEASYAVETDRLESAFVQLLFQHQDAVRRVELYRNTLIPKTTESLRSSVIAFSTGESDFLDLLDTERTLLEFQLALERARADRLKTLAQLDALAGERLPRAPAEGANS